MASEADEVYTYDSVIRGHHVYKLIWTPRMGEQLPLRCEDNNVRDATAVAVMKGIVVAGHLPRVLARTVFYFLKRSNPASEGVGRR